MQADIFLSFALLPFRPLCTCTDPIKYPEPHQEKQKINESEDERNGKTDVTERTLTFHLPPSHLMSLE